MYFLGIEVARSRKRVTLSQRKYVLNMLSDVGIGCRAVDELIEANVKLLPDKSKILDDSNIYRQF